MSTKIDLHCHTKESDGSLSCHSLLERAVDKGVQMLAITDHDTTAAHHKLGTLAHDLPIELISGVEISAVTGNQEVHIVGLGIDIENPELQQLLENNRICRTRRAKRILEKLQKSGLPDLTEPLGQVVTAEVVCRSHLAQLLCNQSITKDFKAAFKRYLGKKGKAWVPVEWQDVALVVEHIRNAGGVAILAHPTKYKLSPNRLGLLIDTFVEAGGNALELAYPGLNPSDRAYLVRQVNRHQLSVSQGSDFHHPGTPWTELGAFGVNSQSFETVWHKYPHIKACH